MKAVQFAIPLVFALNLGAAGAAERVSLHPDPVFPGQPAFVRLDEADGCFEFDGFIVKRSAAAADVEIIGSDLVTNPCLPAHRTPVLLPIGSFDAGVHRVDVRICGFAPTCGPTTPLTLAVGTLQRTVTVPAVGALAMLLSCVGMLWLAASAKRRRVR